MDEPEGMDKVMRLLSTKGALPGLARLKGREMNMGEFATAAGLSDQPARGLRLSLLEMRLIRVTEKKVRGATEIRLRLTPKGEKAARLALDLAKTLARNEAE